MIKKNDFENLSQKIERAKNIALFCHISPDPDTVCSAYAMKTALKKLGKNFEVFCDDLIPDNLDFILSDENMSKTSDLTYDLAIGIDSSDLQRIGECYKVFLSAKDTAAIDHHKSHVAFSSLTILDENRSSCSEIIFDFLKFMKLLDDKTVQFLFAGMIADNGCFQYSNVTKETHKTAEEMYDFNFDKDETIYNIFRRKKFNVFNLTNRVLANSKFYEDGKVAIVRMMKEEFEATDTTIADTSGIIAQLINVDGVEIAYAVSQVAEYSHKISIRTKKYVDANECAACFGGGGHSRAAGCRISGHIEDVCDKLLKVARDRLL